VFGSLKTDLVWRPVYHQIDRRVDGHLSIGVLAARLAPLTRAGVTA
jgi:hypothetical protein